MLGQLNSTDTASAWCLYIPFHKKEILTHSWRWLTALEEITVHSCPMIILEFQSWPHTLAPRHTHLIHTHTKVCAGHTRAYTHTHTPSLGLIADSKPVLQFLSYISLYHPEKRGCSTKISPTSLLPSLSPPPSSLYLRHLSLMFHFWLIQNNLILPTTPKVHFVI